MNGGSWVSKQGKHISTKPRTTLEKELPWMGIKHMTLLSRGRKEKAAQQKGLKSKHNIGKSITLLSTSDRGTSTVVTHLLFGLPLDCPSSLPLTPQLLHQLSELPGQLSPLSGHPLPFLPPFPQSPLPLSTQLLVVPFLLCKASVKTPGNVITCITHAHPQYTFKPALNHQVKLAFYTIPMFRILYSEMLPL